MIGALTSDMTEAEILDQYGLSKAQIKAALAYAANLMHYAEFFPTGA